MRRRVLIVLAALVLAGFSGISVLLYARGVDQRALDGRRAVSVLLATERIAAGTTGAQIRRQGLAKRVVMPAATVPEGALEELRRYVADRVRDRPTQVPSALAAEVPIAAPRVPNAGTGP